MKEAQEGRVDWPDMDEETFARFIQWVYTKIYDEAEPQVLTSQDPEAGPRFETAFTGLHASPGTPPAVVVLPAECAVCHSDASQEDGRIRCKTCHRIFRT